jgi:hypothetical protein
MTLTGERAVNPEEAAAGVSASPGDVPRDYSVAAIRARVNAAWQARTRAVGCTRCDRIVALVCSARKGDRRCTCRCHVVPQRIQLRRTKGWRKPVGAVVVSRPSKWGNRWRVSDFAAMGIANAAQVAVETFQSALESGVLSVTVADVRAELRGKDLLCWCKPGAPCHADVLLEVANR